MSEHSSREFTEVDARLLQVVADRLALPIDRARLYERVVEREGKPQMLAARLLGTLEDERRRIAYDLHDGVARLPRARTSISRHSPTIFPGRSPSAPGAGDVVVEHDHVA
jgi:GAF domain-containing protein